MSIELTVSHQVDKHALHHPRKRAFVLVSGDGVEVDWTWEELLKVRDSFGGHLLTQGVQPGEHVVLLMRNSAVFYVALVALMRLGCVGVPVSTLLSPSAVKALAVKAHCEVIIADQPHKVPSGVFRRVFRTSEFGLQPAQVNVPPLPQCVVAGDQLAHIMFSSGTTGLPKGIALSHRTRFFYGLCNCQRYKIQEDSVVCHAGSLVFNGAFVTLLAALYIGAPYIVLRSFSAELFAKVSRNFNVTHSMMVPTQIIALLRDCDITALSSIKSLISVGAPIPMSVKEELAQRLPGVFNELYGLTEGFTTILSNRDFRERPSSVGKPMPFDEILICDKNGDPVPIGQVGEICGRSLMLFDGYYNDPEKTNAAFTPQGWLRTGDLGRLDKNGYLELSGRSKDMLVSGGVNVYPIDIERVISSHRAVRECSVFGVEHVKWGETPVAAVILSAPVSALDLKQWVNERVDARYERVHDVMILPEFPRNTAGKALKTELRALYQRSHKSKL